MSSTLRNRNSTSLGSTHPCLGIPVRRTVRIESDRVLKLLVNFIEGREWQPKERSRKNEHFTVSYNRDDRTTKSSGSIVIAQWAARNR